MFGFTFFPESYVIVEFWLTGDTSTVTLIDDRGIDEFSIESMPPQAWLIDRLTLAFDISEADASDHVSTLQEQVSEGTSNPSVEVDASVTFPRIYEAIETDRTDATGSATGGDGWYKETSYRDGQRFATVDVIVQSMEIRHEGEDRTYTLKLDRLGGFYLQIRLPVGEEIPEDEYRATFREMFDAIGLPPEVVDDLTFEYHRRSGDNAEATEAVRVGVIRHASVLCSCGCRVRRPRSGPCHSHPGAVHHCLVAVRSPTVGIRSSRRLLREAHEDGRSDFGDDRLDADGRPSSSVGRNRHIHRPNGGKRHVRRPVYILKNFHTLLFLSYILLKK